MKLPMTNFKFRIPIRKKSVTPAAARCAGATGDSQFAIHNSQFARGFALVITLILLSVTLIMAVAFLAISRRERGSVVTSTDTATARYAADAALANAEAQIISTALATTNPYINNLLVSTNYINALGFNPTASPNPTNVNYDYLTSGGGYTVPDFLQNVANLQYLPRVPVFVPTNALGASDFRFYLDLNRNGRFEDSGMVTNLDSTGAGLGTTTFQMGDPQWIGVLERPDAPHGPNNKFLARYAFIALPAGNTLDLNYIHNQALHGARRTTALAQVNQPAAGDTYFRNQGVGSWELNLAAFLADLNTNQWGQVIGNPANGNATYYYYRYNPNSAGYSFDDARALLAYRYTNSFASLAFLPTLMPNYNYPSYVLNGPVDIVPFGPTMTGTGVPFYNYNLNNFLWPGSDNYNHFFALASDLYDLNKTAVGVQPPQINLGQDFTDHLLNAGNGTSTYDRYTFYRLLSQLGTDSSPDAGKMNLNYDNLSPYVQVANVPVYNTNGTASVTNYVAWTPLAFFTNAADRMLRIYTTNWFQGNSSDFYTNYITYFGSGPETNLIYFGPSNYLAAYYGIQMNPPGYFSYRDAQGRYVWNDPSGLGLTNVPLFGMTNQIPSFSLTNIPVYINGQFVYQSAVQRLVQLAANIYDASVTNFYPSVFRPIFEHDNFGDVFISGYTNLASGFGPNTVINAADRQFATPHDIWTLTNYLGSYRPLVDRYGFLNVYGVPWIIGAKKGFPNFNEFSMNNVVQINRKMEIQRPNLNYPPQFNYTNVSYVFGIGSSLGVEFWNAYTNSYARPVQVVLNGSLWMTLTNGNNYPPYQYIVNVFTNMFVPAWSNVAPDSFVYQTHNVNFFTNQAYLWDGTFAQPDTTIWQPAGQSLPVLPQFGLQITNRLQAYMLDGNHVIDYVQLSGPDSSRNLNEEIRSHLGNSASYLNMWTTNLDKTGRQISLNNQIEASLNSAALPINPTYWKGQVSPPAWEIDGFWVFMGGSPGALPMVLPTAELNAYYGYFSNLTHQVPFTPTVTVYDYTTWQANDPLVHYLGSDLNFSQTDSKPATGVNPADYHGFTNFFGKLPNIGQLNARYAPWGILRAFAGSDNNPYNYAYKDPGVTNSDAWDFPTGKFPTVGWLGRVHRGTPWQTVYLKATNIFNLNTPAATGLNVWTNWTGDQNAFDAYNSRPTQDFLLFDIFNTAINDNASRGRLSVNVGANTNTPAAGLAAWSALLSGMVVPTSLTNTYTTINPAGPAGAPVPANPPANPNSPFALGYLVQNGTNGINDIRAKFENPDGLVGTFEHVGNILAVPTLTEQSPFLAGLDYTNGINDAMMEWLPQQTLSLLSASAAPRYVIYCYGQALKPAPNGVVSSGTILPSGLNPFGMVTNYQVVAETATRAVVQFQPVVVTNWIPGTVPPTYYTRTNYNATIEQFNPLPPD